MTARDQTDQSQQEVFNAVDQVLNDYPWLKEISGIYDLLTQMVIDDVPATSIVAQIRQTDEWKKRFAGITQRQAAGLPPISEAEYLSQETGYWQQLRQYNILGLMGLDNPEAFRKWAAERIGQDVSVSEINRRLDRGMAIATEAEPLVQQAFQDFYGVTVSKQALLLWALDENKGLNEIESQITAATVGAEAFRFGLNITRTRAELLQKSGVTADLARRGFADVARETPQLRQLAQATQFQPLTQTQLEDYFFHEDPAVAKRRAQVFSQAMAEFQGGGLANPARGGGLAALVERNQAV